MRASDCGVAYLGSDAIERQLEQDRVMARSELRILFLGLTDLPW